jgi:hypothetical protein
MAAYLQASIASLILGKSETVVSSAIRALKALTSLSISSISYYPNLDLCSFNDFSVLWITESASFLISTNSLLFVSSSLNYSPLLIIS